MNFIILRIKELSKENLNEEKPIKLKFKIISNEQSLNSLPINFLLLKMLINNEDKKDLPSLQKKSFNTKSC